MGQIRSISKLNISKNRERKSLNKNLNTLNAEKYVAKIAYYPGCSLNSTAIDFNISIKNLFDFLGIKLEEIQDWNCCGTTPAHNISHELSVELSSRNLFLAKKMGFNEILSPCVSCYCKLFKAAEVLNKRNIKDTNEVATGSDNSENFNFKIYSIVEYLLKYKDLIKEKYLNYKLNLKQTKKTSDAGQDLIDEILRNLKPVCYYGCVLLRTEDINRFDSFENPTSMERVLETVDIKCNNFSFKTECCGAILSLTHKDIVLKLSKRILDVAIESGANSIIVCCPLCQQNLDMRQNQINKYYKAKYNIPIYYISQILGLSLGLSYKDMAINKLFVLPEINK